MSDIIETTATAAPRVATPAEELTVLVTWAAGAFYWAEEGVNPRVTSYWDALQYVATSLSVGYATVFPVTAIGKAIGAVVMMIGPALSARALDGGSASRPGASDASDASDAGAEGTAMLGAKLDAILVELRRLNAED
jgi:hypothetical protein